MLSNIGEIGDKRKWLVIAAVGLGVFAATLNLSIINISLPAIQTAFDADLATVEWVVLIYSIILAVSLISVGRLSDIIGRKVLYIAGLVGFTAGAMLCGLSGSILFLIAARAVQAIGGALLVGNSVAIITDNFPKNELGKAMGTVSGIAAIGTTVGPSFGGFILEQFSWPWIFFINIPIGISGIVLSVFAIQEKRVVGSRQRFDLWGAATLAICLFSGLMGITHGQENGWNSPGILVLFSVSIIFGVLFFYVERRTSQPLLNLQLFRNRLISIPLLCFLFYWLAFSANTFLMPFLLQQIFGYSAQTTGFLLISVPLTLGFVAPFSGRLYDRIGSQLLTSLGLALCGLSFISQSYLGLDAPVQSIIPRLVLLGIGGGLFQSPNDSSLMSAVPTDQRGVAAGLSATSRHMGFMFGTALMGAIWVSRSIHYAGASHIGFDDISQTAVLLGIQDALLVAGVICLSIVILAWKRGAKESSVDEVLISNA